MPAPETSDRYDDAVLWEKTGQDRYNEPSLAAPVDLKVRWERVRKEITDKTGTTVVLEAMVVVDREIPIGSLMWQGLLEDYLSVGSAGEGTELMRVATYEEVADVKDRFILREVGLAKFRDKV